MDSSSPPSLFVPFVLVWLVFVPLVWFVATRNRFVRLQNLMRESWANIDVLLRRRYDLIPNLVETVKGYAAHEQEVFDAVAEARARAVADVGSVGHQAQTESQLVRILNQLLVRVEAYPELKASAHYLALHTELVNTEDRIAAARRFFNANVRDFNLLLESFPSSIVGNSMGAVRAEFFEVDELQIRAVPQVALQEGPFGEKRS